MANEALRREPHCHYALNTSSATAFLRPEAELSRASRLLEDEPECSAHGYQQVGPRPSRLGGRRFNGRPGPRPRGVQGAIGRRLGDIDLEAFGLHDEGHVLIARGDVDAGRALVDEAAAMCGAASNPYTTGMVYCGSGDLGLPQHGARLATCRRVDRRASLRWCERESFAGGGFPGLCRFHRAEVRRLRGELDNAERDALDAIEELLPANLIATGWALTELGEIRRRRGDQSGARDAFRRAQELGGLPQPGLALLLLDDGKPDAALASITDALAQMVGVHQEDRGSVLPAAVTIALAAGRIDRARDGLAELESMGEAFHTTAALASVAEARGQVQLANDDADSAITSLREACGLWCEVDAPFEAARARLLIAGALRVGGHESTTLRGAGGGAEARSNDLGAVREAERVRSMLHGARRSRVTRTLMFTDIVDSTRLVEVLGDDAWGNLLHWHDRTLRQCFDAANGREVNHEGDGFFVAFADSLDAVECAIAIQRTLADHRREHGFAPQVRIGVHATEAVDLGDDYLGKGVHQAARVGAAAGAGEILVTASVIDSVTDHCHIRNRREVGLRRGSPSPSLCCGSVEWQ